jgi:aquaporin Z
VIQTRVETAREKPGALKGQMLDALKRHWPEYLCEAALLGLFMLSACAFGALIFHPSSPVVAAVPDPALRRALMGAAMGATAVSLVYSPWGKRSGAHFNPSVTLAFFRLGKIKAPDALFYVLAQFAGGVLGALAAVALLGAWLADPAVNYVVTRPGPYGVPAAFAAEAIISFALMTVVLAASNTPRLARLTGLFAGALVMLYVGVEAPLSGMSMNPARTFSSAFAAQIWTALWLYFTAPPLGMLLAAELYTRFKGAGAVRCAKLHHRNAGRCIFNCGYKEEVRCQMSDVGEDGHVEVSRRAPFETAKLLLTSNI